MDWERMGKDGSPLAGALGAGMGAVLGAAALVLDSRFGGVSLVGGILLPLCIIEGYALLGGRLGKLGAALSGALILVAVWCANQVCFALEIVDLVEGVDFWDALQHVYAYEEAKVIDGYWAQLMCFYFLVGAGSIPTLVGLLPKPARRPAGIKVPPMDEPPPMQGTFYALRKDWMRPLRLSVFGPLLAIMVLVVGGFLAITFVRETRLMTAMILGGFVSGVVLLCGAIPTLRLCNAFHILFVQAGGRLWRVDLQRFCSVLDWWSQPPDRQEAIQRGILCEISRLLDGGAPSCGPGALTELRDLQVKKENPWSWKCCYQSQEGKRKKLQISKGYPALCPASGLERSQGPTPARWSFLPLSVVLTAAIIAGFWAADMPVSVGPAWNRSHASASAPEPAAQPAVKAIPARTPETVTEYEMSEVWFRVDGAFQYSRRTFLDGATGTLYRAYVQYGVDASGAWDTLSQYISKYHTSPLFDRFDAVFLDQEPLTPLYGTFRYNIVSVYLTDGRVFHTAVLLSEEGTLFTMEAQQDASDQSEAVLSNLMFTLESVRFGGPAVTEENYPAQIHVSEVRGCTYMAAAYLKTDLFGHEALVDVYVPYSERPVYSAGGRAIRTQAHGLRVYATIVPGKNAKAVVDARQQELAATGRVYEDGVDDETYREDLDAACKLTVYEEDGQKRQAVLYADSKWEGYYLLREITGLSELVDEEYAAALKELEEILGLTMPALEELGGL